MVSKLRSPSSFSPIESKQTTITVAVRIKPCQSKDKSKEPTVHASDSNNLVLQARDLNTQNSLSSGLQATQTYQFDYVYDDLTTQEALFSSSCKEIIQDVYNGINGTIFAYGATGSGKTYTIIGGKEKPGIVPRTIQLLSNIRKDQCIIKLSFFEIYNEIIKDLLVEIDEKQAYDGLEIREEPIKGVTILNLSEFEIFKISDFQRYLIDGTCRRTTEPTNVNQESSRSHGIIQISIQRKLAEKNGEIRTAKLYLIDLAGSERASQTQNKGIRFKEGANINKSLLALGNCINALSSAKATHVPFRDSKLTRILKESLGGNCRTLMIATLSSIPSCFEDTYNTLKYAIRAKAIKGSVKINVISEKTSIEGYVKQIQTLKEQLLAVSKESSKNPNIALDPLEKIIQKIDKHFQYEHSLYNKLSKAVFRIATLRLDIGNRATPPINGANEEKLELAKLEKEEKMLTEEANKSLNARNALIEEAENFTVNNKSLNIAKKQITIQSNLVVQALYRKRKKNWRDTIKNTQIN